MYSHIPENYHCPFCSIASDETDPAVATMQDDVVFKDAQVTAFIASHWWPNNPGHVIIIPNQHYENIFDLPVNAATAIHAAARDIAFAMKHQ
jgi:histidine triad (HIT) family protein